MIRIHDTLTGELRPLEPREPGKVGIYACGPTVYGRIHVGNARPFVVFLLFKRFLEHAGLDAQLVVNAVAANAAPVFRMVRRSMVCMFRRWLGGIMRVSPHADACAKR